MECEGKGFLKSFLCEDRGQAVIEYVLILSVATVGAAALARTIINVLDKGVLRIGGQLEKDLKTGRAPLGVWKN